MARMVLVGLLLVGAPVLAQSPDGGVEEPATADAGTPAPAAATAAPAPSLLLPPSWWEWIRPYGIAKVTVTVAGAAVESFSQPNSTAPTAAGNPVIAASPELGRASFQVGQSRVGVALNEKGAFRGKLEIDFVDFTKASPTVASVPRLRIATIDWLPTNAITLSVGQDWDLFSPVVPHGANLVGGNFNAGNAGFMRQQIKLLGKVGSRLELAGAVGFAGVNATSKDGPIELGLLPSVALRATVLLDKYGKLGASGIAAPVLFSQGAPAERRAVAAAGNVFADLSFSTTQLRGEWYVAQNLANIGALTLAYGTTATDVQEMGGYVSIRQALNEMNFIYGRAGIARVMNPAAVVPSYRYASLPADGSPPATSTATLAGTGPGIRGNLALVAGYELRVLKPLAFHLEGFFFRTEHALLEVDSARFSTVRFVGGAELTAMLTL